MAHFLFNCNLHHYKDVAMVRLELPNKIEKSQEKMVCLVWCYPIKWRKSKKKWYDLARATQ